MIVPVLSAAEEHEAQNRMRSNARKQCESEIQEFLDCMSQKTFMIAFKCQGLKRIMSDCCKRYTNDDYGDKYRKEMLEERK